MTTDDSHISAHTANTVCPIKSQLIQITEAATTAIAARFGNGPIESPLNALVFIAARPTA